MSDQIQAVYGLLRSSTHTLRKGEIETKIRIWNKTPNCYKSIVINGMRCDNVRELQSMALTMGLL